MKKDNKEKEKIDFRYNLKVYWSLLKKYKLLFFFLLGLILVLEGVRVVGNFLFKIVVDDGTRFVDGSLSLDSFYDILVWVAVVFAIFAIIKSIGHWVKIHFINILDSRVMFDLKRKFFNHIIHLSYDFHTSHKTGSMISRIIRGGSAIERMTDVILFNFAPLLFQFIIVAVSLVYFDVWSALIVLMIVVLFISYSLLINRMQEKSSIAVNKAEDREKANVSDAMTNIESIKYFGKENYVKKKFKSFALISKDALVRNWNFFRWFDSGQSILLSSGTFLLMFLALSKFLKGDMSMGTVVFIFTIYNNLFGPLFGFVHGIRNYYRSMADFQELFKYGKFENEIKDKPDAKKLKISKGNIEFRNVSFRYKKKDILKNFNLVIPEKKKVAFVGPSGSGKTTLIRLIYRLYDINEGNILIDGKDIRDFRQESLRSELSIVPQECILFDDTIYNNIAFSRRFALKSDVFKAMKFAQLLRIVENFPDKEKTIVGERGVKLSGGEKQRVSIARAILADKKILVLDEATSSLDSETEFEIQKDLEKLMENRTSIIIAHRLSTIMKADLIVVLDKGRIVQQGTHEELINKEGMYKKLWSLQKGGYIK